VPVAKINALRLELSAVNEKVNPESYLKKMEVLGKATFVQVLVASNKDGVSEAKAKVKASQVSVL
jgi:hypothetical protein